MPAKEKALKLVDRFRQYAISKGIKKNELNENDFKECALICVDELITEHTWKNPLSWNESRLKYWQQVKAEIEKQ